MKHVHPQSLAIDGISKSTGGITLREHAAIEIYTAIIAGRRTKISEYLDEETRLSAIKAADELLADLRDTAPKEQADSCPGCSGEAALHSGSSCEL